MEEFNKGNILLYQTEDGESKIEVTFWEGTKEVKKIIPAYKV